MAITRVPLPSWERTDSPAAGQLAIERCGTRVAAPRSTASRHTASEPWKNSSNARGSTCSPSAISARGPWKTFWKNWSGPDSRTGSGQIQRNRRAPCPIPLKARTIVKIAFGGRVASGGIVDAATVYRDRPDLHAQMGAEGGGHIEQNFTWERATQQYKPAGWTRHWSAPEQMLAEPVSSATDIFSLGQMFVILLNGQLFGEVRKFKLLHCLTVGMSSTCSTIRPLHRIRQRVSYRAPKHSVTGVCSSSPAYDFDPRTALRSRRSSPKHPRCWTAMLSMGKSFTRCATTSSPPLS